jgi:type VI secretion system secreted protein VgrG
MRIQTWEKGQELRSGKYTLWDHCFELPHKHLEAEKLVADAVDVGKVKHKLLVGGNDKLEIYDYPGGYAQRFDGVDAGGGDKSGDLQKIFEDNKRTVGIRIQQATLPGLRIRGVSTCRQFVSGHKFTLERHFNADGAYLLTSLDHQASLADYRSGEGSQLTYENRFTCIPLALPYRPPLATPKPSIHGTQTAVIVGPPGSEEIFTDKYGRVKVQFHWDREGKYNPDSSCWIRVSTIWAGKGYGVFHLPRRGQEVIIGFEEGDPDRPIVLGSVYNAEMMPAKKLPTGKKVSGMKSASNQAGGGGYNEISFDDTHDSEMMTIHGQKDLTGVIENDESWTVHNNRKTQIDGTETETIKGDTLITISSGTYQHNVAGNTAKYHVSSDIQEFYDANQTTKVGADITIQSGGSIQITAATQIQLHVGASTLLMKSDGSIQLNGVNIGVDGSSQVNIHGGQILSSADGANNISGGSIVSAADGTNTVQGATVLLNP